MPSAVVCNIMKKRITDMLVMEKIIFESKIQKIRKTFKGPILTLRFPLSEVLLPLQISAVSLASVAPFFLLLLILLPSCAGLGLHIFKCFPCCS